MKNKGFTIVELLAVILILALLMTVGMYTVTNINDNAETRYYETMENTLKIAGNDYFNDNRADRPIDDYNFISMNTLVDHEYMDSLTKYNSTDKCDVKSGIYIYNTSSGNEYEVCLICDDYKSDGAYCNGNKPGQIEVTGKTNTGAYYNPVLSYSGTPWANVSSVDITYKLMGDDTVGSYIVYNAENNREFIKCTEIKGDKSCTNTFFSTGSYYVVAYRGNDQAGNRKYFNVKIDNSPPDFELRDTTTEFFLGNEDVLYEYKNEVIKLIDDNGYNAVTYSLVELDTTSPRINIENEDLIEKDLKFEHALPSGRYQLTVTVSDYAGNKKVKSYLFKIEYYVSLGYYDNSNVYHNLSKLKVYKNGTYANLPLTVDINGVNKNVDWYDNTSYAPETDKYTDTRRVTKDGYHILYGHEGRKKAKYNLTCNNGGNFTYNGGVQELATAETGYTLTNNRQTNAGTYIIIAKLDKDYTWENGTRTNKVITCTIKPYKVNFNPSNTCKSLTFNGKNQVLVSGTPYSDLAGNATTSSSLNVQVNHAAKTETSYTIGNLYRKNAGSQSVTFTLGGTNYVWADGSGGTKTYNCTVNPYKVNFNPNSSPCRGGLVYNEKYQPLTSQAGSSDLDSNKASTTISGTFDGTSYNEYTVSNGYRKEAGSQNVSYSLSSANFAWSDGTRANKSYSCSISKRSVGVSKSSTRCRAGQFNGTYQPLTNNPNTSSAISISSGASGGAPNAVPAYVSGLSVAAYSITNPYGFSAGSYSTTFHLLDFNNYTWADGSTSDFSVNCSISKYPVKVEWGTTTEFTYDGNKHAPEVKNTNGTFFVIDYQRTDETNAGNYTSTATCYHVSISGYGGGCNNFEYSNTTKNYKIKPVVVTAPTATSHCNTGLVYNGSSRTLTKAAPAHVTFRNNTRTNAGSQTITATLESTTNYKWSDNTTAAKTFSCSISTKSLKVEWYDVSSFVYTGSAIGPSTKPLNGVNGEVINLQSSKQVPAGSYTSTASCSSVRNGQALCSNYSLTNTSFAYEIARSKQATTGSCNSNAKPDGSSSIVTGALFATYSNNTTTSVGKKTVTVTADSNYAFSDGSTSKKVTCTMTATVQHQITRCSVHNSCENSTCTCKEHNSCVNNSCTCKTYNSCVSSKCTCKTYNSCQNGSCACKTYKSCQHANCGTTSGYSSWSFSSKYCAEGTTTAGVWELTKTVCSVESCSGKRYTCRIYKRSHTTTTNTCQTAACGCAERYSCRDASCGCAEYNSCENSDCTCKERNACVNDVCSCKKYNSCVADSCSCKTWGDPEPWTTVSKCEESTSHTAKIRCRTLYSNS